MYEFHELANIFPLINGDEFESFKEDIRVNGQINPIWLHENKIIDGRNRYRACTELGILPVFEKWSGEGSLVSFVISLNLKRRDLTPSQRAFISLELLPMLEAEAKKKQRLAGVNTHGHRHEDKDLQLAPLVEQAVNVDQPILRGPEAAQQAATLLGIGKSSVYDAKRIAAAAPERIEDIKQGRATIKNTLKELKNEGIIKSEPRPTKNSIKHESKNEVIEESGVKETHSTAFQFSTIAISQLERIRNDDHNRVEAFTEVMDYIKKQLNI